MNKTLHKKSIAPQINTITIVGSVLIVIGCLASLYGTHVNGRFITMPAIDLIYYLRYLLLLGGGFIIGYFFIKDDAMKRRQEAIYRGVVYSLFSISLSNILDYSRVSVLQDLALPNPLGRFIFEGMPLVALIGTAIVAYFVQYRNNLTSISIFTKLGLVVLFVAGQAYLVTTVLFAAPNFSIPPSLLTSPLVIGGIAFYFFAGLKDRTERWFYSALIGTMYAAFTTVVWEFQTDPFTPSITLFNAVTTSVAVVSVAALLWHIHTQLKH